MQAWIADCSHACRCRGRGPHAAAWAGVEGNVWLGRVCVPESVGGAGAGGCCSSGAPLAGGQRLSAGPHTQQSHSCCKPAAAHQVHSTAWLSLHKWHASIAALHLIDMPVISMVTYIDALASLWLGTGLLGAGAVLHCCPVWGPNMNTGLM